MTTLRRGWGSQPRTAPGPQTAWGSCAQKIFRLRRLIESGLRMRNHRNQILERP